MSHGERFDAGVVGAGILGLAHAYLLAKRGLRVAVFERDERAQGASVRNFGMIWPIGQPLGSMRDLALRSREIWREMLSEAQIWHEETGSLHLAYHDDEAQVLREFVSAAREADADVEMLTAAQVLERSPAAVAHGLRGGMWSPTEICVDPRQVIEALPRFLAERYGVRFSYACPVSVAAAPLLTAGGRDYAAERLFCCCGDEFRSLFPEAFPAEPLLRCKLQMMRTAPMAAGWRLGPMLAAGLTLRHYRSFECCPTLPALRARFQSQMPLYERYGIHVMASQNGAGEVVIGDSHEYNDEISPFDNPEIDRLILEYLQTFARLPETDVAARWHGIYVKHPRQPYSSVHARPDTRLVCNAGGAGMTLSFGIAERVVAETFG